MSRKSSRINKPEPVILNPKRKSSNTPREFTIPSKVSKPTVTPGIRIEERLLNQQITYNKRLEILKKNQEQEQMREIRDKPKILDRSRALAEKAEKRMMQDFIQIKKPKQNTEKEHPQVQPDFIEEKIASVDTSHNHCALNYSFEEIPTPCIKQPIENHLPDRPQMIKKKRTKSLSNLSVFKRNEIWLAEKEKKIGLRRINKTEKELVGCTFTPVTQKNRQNRSVRDANSSNLSYLSSPSAEPFRFYEKSIHMQKNVYRPIAPFQVKVSFRCGIDLNSFFKRAK